ncbi:MAG: hypothetical protein JW862_17760 [Anaerolineales bacterium]|nr:hypothetical protein [Anaerolineales bacterium]
MLPYQAASLALIPSAYLNALGIAEGLRAVGWPGRVVCLDIEPQKEALTGRYPELCETISLSTTQAQDLPAWVEKQISTISGNVLFFTDERFQEQFARHYGDRKPAYLQYWPGSQPYFDRICQRAAFYAFVNQHTPVETPRLLPGTEDPWSVFPDGFYLRVNRSWQQTRKLPRGRVILTPLELRQAIALYQEQALSANDWFYQELLSTRPEDNLSICGWHAPGQRTYFATQPRQRLKNGTAVVVQQVPAPANLLQTTRTILEQLEYAGPFEMEFVRAPHTGVYKVIELNPRFWMQHRFVDRAANQVLIRRYLGLAVEETSVPLSQTHFWIDRIGALEMLTGGHLGVLPYLLRPGSAYPSWGKALHFFLNAHRPWDRPKKP